MSSGVVPGADLEADAAKEKARKDAGVSALLFDSFPIRYWDHYLGPRVDHFLVADAPVVPEGRSANLRDVTPDADVIGLSGLVKGAPFTADTIPATKRRLEQSGQTLRQRRLARS